MPLTEEQFERYSRQIVLPEIAAAGQERLARARVAVIGAGGLGSPALLYLAAAGVGRLDVVDPDVVSLSNLHRQILHRTAALGRPKTESAAQSLRELNPEVEVFPHPVYLAEENALELLAPADVVLDASDNFPTRYLTNDACFFLRKPLVFGALSRFEGQWTVFRPGDPASPCYRCLFPEPPPPELVRPCSETGVLGALAGVIGSLQAMECLKLLLGAGSPPIGRLMILETLGARARSAAFPRDPRCALCGERPAITRLESTGHRACEIPWSPPRLA